MTMTAFDTAEREIAMTRIFDAPRALVWEVWTDPEHLGRWWGPNGFTNTTKTFEFRPGGQCLFTIHGPDGTDYRNENTFTVIIEPERIEFDHGPAPKFHTTVTFDVETEKKTKLSMQMLFSSREERDSVAEKFGAVEGLKQTLGRLGEYLVTQQQEA